MSSNNIHMSTRTAILPYSAKFDIAPLTRIFTYSAGCLNRWFVLDPASYPPTVISGPVREDESHWSECQPFGNKNTYSPGVCPSGQTLAHVTEVQYRLASSSVLKQWSGICCPRELPYNAESSACWGSISTPIEAFVPFTRTSTSTRSFPNTSYTETETVTQFFPTTPTTYTDDYGTLHEQSERMTNISTITEGIVMAVSLLVIWEESDISRFPSSYATSLAKQIGVLLASNATPGSTSSLPSETAPIAALSPAHGLSTEAKVGIGVGFATSALIIVALAAVLVRRGRAHRTKRVSES